MLPLRIDPSSAILGYFRSKNKDTYNYKFNLKYGRKSDNNQNSKFQTARE